jgi:hypothetical protein
MQINKLEKYSTIICVMSHKRIQLELIFNGYVMLEI